VGWQEMTASIPTSCRPALRRCAPTRRFVISGASAEGPTAAVGHRAAGRGCRPVPQGRPWSLPLQGRVLPVAARWRTSLILRKLAPLSGVSKSAQTHRPQTVSQGHSADHGQHTGPQPRPHHRRAVQELPTQQGLMLSKEIDVGALDCTCTMRS
jgi:hypothetical protein